MKKIQIVLILLMSITTIHAVDNKFSLDILLGANISWIKSDGLLERYFIPIEKSEKNLFGYNWGLGINFKFTNLVQLSLEGHYQKCGILTEERNVTFPESNNTTIQYSLITEHEFTYLTFPLYVKFGYTFEHQWFNLGFGPAVSWRISYHSEWYLDGKVSSLPPHVSFQDWDAAASFKGEYGYRVNEKNGVFLMGTYNLGIYNIVADGPDGKAKSRIISLFLAYRYFF